MSVSCDDLSLIENEEVCHKTCNAVWYNDECMYSVWGENYDPCEEGDDENEDCPEEISDMSAVDACARIKTLSDEMDAEVQKAKDTAEAIPLFGQISRAIGVAESKASSDQTAINEIKATMKSVQESEQFAQCTNEANTSQVNELVVTETCGIEMAKLGIEIEVSGNRQELENKTEQTCQINLIAEAMASAKPSVEAQAIQDTINKAMNGKSESEAMSCNQMDASTTACTYLKQRQCCHNAANAEQKNIMNVCAARITDNEQKALNENLQSCIMGADTEVTASNEAEATTSVEQTSDNSATGGAAGLALISGVCLCMCLVLCAGGAVLMTNKIPKPKVS